MEEKKIVKETPMHTAVLENRNQLTLSGVTDVETYDENAVHLLTQMGGLTVEGEDLHIQKLSLETGELSVEGVICGLVYHDDGEMTPKGGFFKRLFQ